MGKVDDKRQRRKGKIWQTLVQDPRRNRKIHPSDLRYQRKIQRVPCELQFPGKVAVGSQVFTIRPRRIRPAFTVPDVGLIEEEEEEE